MKVLITGGAGFIGSHLADRLLDEDHEVLVIDNYATGRRDNLTERDGLDDRRGHDRGPGRRRWRRSRASGPTSSSTPPPPTRTPRPGAPDVLTNALGTVNVVKAAQATGVERLLYFQTALCYGTTPTEQPVTLDHPIRPDSSYGISKTAGEQYIELSGLDFVSFRLANAYGPRNISGPLPTFYHRLTEGKGVFVMDTRRDFIYVDDLIDVVMQAVVDGTGHGHYHISSGLGLRDQGAVRRHDRRAARGRARRGRRGAARKAEDDAYTILLDPSRVQQDFGWEPKVPLEEGVRRAIEYYREYGISQTYTHLKVGE